MSASAISAIKAAAATQLRARRTKARLLKQRHDALIDSLARALPSSVPMAGLFTEMEGFIVMAGHLVGAISVARRIARRALLHSGRPISISAVIVRRDVPRPTRIVAETRHPNVLPGLVAEQPDCRVLSVEAAIDVAMHDFAAGHTPFRVLDFFRTATDLRWDSAAAILYNAGVFHVPLSAETIEMAARARRFWTRWQHARYAYSAAVHLGQVEPANGDWGLLEADHVTELLPDFLPPKSALRNEWLIRMVRKLPTSLIDLDFHASTYHPLFRVAM